MSEQETKRTAQGPAQQADHAARPSPLQGERGGTSISETVVAKVAGIAAQEVDGIRMGGATSQAVGGFIGSITGGSQTQGVSVEVGQEEAAIDLVMSTEYGKSIPQLTEAVRRNVINRIENLVGLRVTEVNITVGNIFFPQEEENGETQREEQGG
ncbi:MAG: Asp23/Gls24 family envelope stress response protein [Rubrobacteraceae bacterium]|uniref:Asp23/Gls24 family envelope stress response protein n=1 Tax=Rubrobacter calidifluminis TaxID=1392640 RepID=UPI00235FD84A|nr:Asp23/Gls24 family envelope stress response protein [Rubrobacter calidifluminis]MBX6764924.1 Asp23/Gls24 family envelope stress response protein [Rubrobacteraceae bacterium]